MQSMYMYIHKYLHTHLHTCNVAVMYNTIFCSPACRGERRYITNQQLMDASLNFHYCKRDNSVKSITVEKNRDFATIKVRRT